MKINDLERENVKLRQQLAEAETCSDAKEQDYGCFRAVRAERQLAEAQKNFALATKRISAAERIISRGIDLMSLEQLSRWEGVRAWQESDLLMYAEDAATAAPQDPQTKEGE